MTSGLVKRFADTDLVPMSREDMTMRGCRNCRGKGYVQLWYVDGLGNAHQFITSEIAALGLDDKYPEYLERNLGIRAINESRRIPQAAIA